MAAKEIAEDGMIIPNNNQRRLTTTVGFKNIRIFSSKNWFIFQKQKAGGYCEICGTKYEEDLRLVKFLNWKKTIIKFQFTYR